MVLDVREAHTELVLGDVVLRVGSEVAVLLCLPGGEALRQLGLMRVEFFCDTFVAEFIPDAFKDLSGVIEEAPHVGPHQALRSLSDCTVSVKLAPWPVGPWTSSANH